MHAEDIFIQEVVKLYLDERRDKESLLSCFRSLNQERLIEKIYSHGLEGIANYVFQRLNLFSFFPEEFNNRIKWGARNTMMVNMLYNEEFKAILKDLKDNGIVPVVVKGMLFLNKLYDNFSLRPMSDIDLIVREDEYFRVITVLKEKGFRESDFLPLRKWERENFRCALTKRSLVPINVEVHKQLSQPYRFRFSIEDLFTNLKTIEVNRFLIQTPDPVYTLIFLIHHLGMHYFNVKLIWVVDIVKFLYKEEIDWDKILYCVKKYRMETCFYMVGKMLKPFVKEEALDKFNVRIHSLKKFYLNIFYSNNTLNFFRFPEMNVRIAQFLCGLALIDGWRDRLGTLYSYLKIRAEDYL